jgi:KaiC/GvpD/RAD55 family RecA-like ATPase
MFTDTIKGLEKVFKTNVYERMTILAVGHAGTLKSSFVYNLLSKHLENNPDKIGMYATLEQTKESLLSNIQRLGIKPCDRLHIADYNRTREMYKNESERADFLDLTERLIATTKQEHQDEFVCFALDSINALYTLTETDNLRERRKRMYYFFKLLRDNDLTSFLIKELSKIPSRGDDEEYFLADGVIELGIRSTLEGKKRYLEVLKMRQNEHSMRNFIIEFGNEGLAILGPSVDDREVK